MTAAADWPVWSTAARLIVTEDDRLDEARTIVQDLLARIDKACSRFRPDSELAEVQRAGGRPVPVSPLLADLVRQALRAAARTDGDVDPTIGAWLCELGYDRDLGDLPENTAAPRVSVHLAPDWRQVTLEDDVLTVPAGVLLDLGATAKAYAADLAAAAVAAEIGGGVVVGLGGDIATSGPAPDGFWRVRVQDGADQPGTTITLPAGNAIATSSILRRRWRRGSHVLHHIVDPHTGLPAVPVWRTVTAAAADCVTANTATPAALVRGPAAPSYLAGTGLPARLVAADGHVLTVGRWPRRQQPVGAAA